MNNLLLNQEYWSNRYKANEIGWDIGYPSTPIKEYIDQLEDKSLSILIPGGGNSYEAEYLFSKGFNNTYVIDIAKEPLDNLSNRSPEFPKENLIHKDFFSHVGQYDIIIEQTFFCAINPSLRKDYIKQMAKLLKPTGKLVGLLFDVPLNSDHPPYGGSREEYVKLFEQAFNVNIMETAYNSILPRKEKELFINLSIA